ncbi:COX15/CtaA family protein, partial [Cutibacterium acnes subsp. acnes]|nr:COX15/CtaA family protein [Cutibacterium acnes subsp. acnes]
MANTVTTRNAVPRGVVVLFAVTAVAITVTLALGSTVCATDASASCPNWPGCYVGR